MPHYSMNFTKIILAEVQQLWLFKSEWMVGYECLIDSFIEKGNAQLLSYYSSLQIRWYTVFTNWGRKRKKCGKWERHYEWCLASFALPSIQLKYFSTLKMAWRMTLSFLKVPTQKTELFTTTLESLWDRKPNLSLETCWNFIGTVGDVVNGLHYNAKSSIYANPFSLWDNSFPNVLPQ